MPPPTHTHIHTQNNISKKEQKQIKNNISASSHLKIKPHIQNRMEEEVVSNFFHLRLVFSAKDNNESF